MISFFLTLLAIGFGMFGAFAISLAPVILAWRNGVKRERKRLIELYAKDPVKFQIWMISRASRKIQLEVDRKRLSLFTKPQLTKEPETEGIPIAATI